MARGVAQGGPGVRTDPAAPVIGDLLAGAVAGLAVAMPVGAIGAYLIGLGARERIAVAAAAASGSPRSTVRTRWPPPWGVPG